GQAALDLDVHPGPKPVRRGSQGSQHRELHHPSRLQRRRRHASRRRRQSRRRVRPRAARQIHARRVHVFPMKRIAIALVLVASTASASSPDSDPSKGGDAPPSSGPSDARNIGIEQVDKDKVAEEQATKKKVRFEGGATWESHALFVQNDLQGSAPDKFFLYYGG